MSILLPLYVYPSAGAWDPLYTAAKAHRDVDFTVVINPCSGPCMGSLPDKVYLDEIPNLKNYSNIRTLGYVATNYTTKPINDVLSEIHTYTTWPKLTNNTKLKVDGIFFDETPSEYDPAKYSYLKTAAASVRNATNFRDKFIVHNPGLVSPTILNSKTYLQQSYMNLSDITVVFEESFTKWLDKSNFDALQSHKIKKSKLAVLIHSIPTVAGKVLDFVVEQMEDAADWVFLTDVGATDQYYHSFSGLFEGFVRAVDG
ncbi:Spherulation-specific family 4 [Lophiotrema nucula]|uniref:Spherulation-specific family 4 n=1 Tax=Lophiotrema nucula TaxID=690887 RepID=A0A6A5YTA6_9PLEO|nr:Spherulation-specific family 4 [Lophiotrema nucula]